MQRKFQQFVQMTVVASALVHPQSWTLQLCHSDRYPFRAIRAQDRGDSSVQFLGNVVELPLLCNDRCRVRSSVSWRCRYCSSSTVVDVTVVVVQTVHRELSQMQFFFFDSLRNSSCGSEASLGCKLRENR